MAKTAVAEEEEVETKQVLVEEALPPDSKQLEVSLRAWDRVIRGLLYALVFLMPLLFTPWTVEPLEFSKQMLLVLLVSAALIAWLLKMLLLRRWQFVKTPLDLPILVLVAVYFLASLFSVDRIASFLGFYGSFSGNFFQLLFLVIFYYLVVNNFQTSRQLRQLAGVFFFAAFLAVLYAVLQFFGWFALRLPFAKVTSFNTIGSLLTLGLFAGFVVILSLGLKAQSWYQWPSGRLYRILGLLASILILLSINFLYAWAALLLGLLVYLILEVALSKDFNLKNFAPALVLLVLVISVLVIQLIFPFISLRGLFNFNLPLEVRLDYTTAAPVLKGVLQDRPVLGLGPNTFIYAFSKHRDPAFNLSPFWNVRFDKAPSEAAEFLMGAGLVGFLAFEILNLIFILFGLFFLFQKKDQLGWQVALAFYSAMLVLWFAHWFFFFNTLLAFSFWLAVSGFMAAVRVAGAERVKVTSFSLAGSPRQTVSIVSGVSLTLVLVIVFLFFAASVYASDIFYRKGLVSSNNRESLDEAQANFERAIRLNRFRPDYYLTYSEFLILRINQELTRPDPNPGLIQSFLATSINTSRAAVNLSPNNWTAWERLASLYTQARPLVAGVDRFIIDSLERATEHDVNNPILFVELGQIHRLAARRIDPAILGKGVDSDSDGLSDEQEKVLGSDPDDPDSNGNNVLDGNEVLAGLNPAGSGALPEAFLNRYVKTDQESLLAAEKAFRRAIELKRDYATAYAQLALTLEQAGQAEGAIAELEKALEQFPFNLGLKFELGRIYFNNGKVDLAARQFQEIVAVVPNHANARYSLALSYERLGKLGRALQEFQRVLELNPDNQALQEKVKQLEGASK